MAAGDGDTLKTPVADEAGPTLLQQITEQGGYAYVSSLGGGDAEAARQMAWEQLHSGPWHEVAGVWREAYALACMEVAKGRYGRGEYGEAVRVLDMGLIMGGMMLRDDLENGIKKIMDIFGGFEMNGHGGGEFVNGDVNVEEILHVLPKQSLSRKLIVKRPALSLEGFLQEYFLSASPVILTDCMAHWPARTRWNDMDYL